MLKEQTNDWLRHDPQATRSRNGEQRSKTNAIGHGERKLLVVSAVEHAGKIGNKRGRDGNGK